MNKTTNKGLMLIEKLSRIFDTEPTNDYELRESRGRFLDHF